MEMEMEDGLSGNAPVVGEDVEAVKLQAFHCCLRNRVSGLQQSGECGGLNLKKIPAVVFRNHQRMAEVNRIDVEDAKGVLVLKENLGGNLAGNNLAENAVVHFFQMTGGSGLVNTKSIKK